MKFEVTVRSGSRGAKHVLEISSRLPETLAAGRLQFALDGAAGEAEWAEVLPGVYSLILGGNSYEVWARKAANPGLANSSYEVSVGSHVFRVEVQDHRARWRRSSSATRQGPQEILAPMPGRIVKLLVAENADVSSGEGLLVIEAMKMQNELRAPRAGRVEKIQVREGEAVEAGATLVRLL